VYSKGKKKEMFER